MLLNWSCRLLQQKLFLSTVSLFLLCLMVKRVGHWFHLFSDLCACLHFLFSMYLLVLNLALYSIYFFILCLPLIPILKQGWHIQKEYYEKINPNRAKDAIENSPMSFTLQQHSFVMNLETFIVMFSLTVCGLVLHFSIHELVFMLLADFDRGYTVCHCLLSFSHIFFISCCVFLCSSVGFVRLCCIPRCFPSYNIWIRQKKEKKKKYLAYFSL